MLAAADSVNPLQWTSSLKARWRGVGLAAMGGEVFYGRTASETDTLVLQVPE